MSVDADASGSLSLRPGQSPGLHTNRMCAGLFSASDRDPTQTSSIAKMTVLTLVTGNFKG